MSEQPRAARIAEGYKDEGMYNRQKLSPKEIARRIEPLIGLIASGEIPLDDTAAKAIAAYVEEHHARSSKSK